MIGVLGACVSQYDARCTIWADLDTPALFHHLAAQQLHPLAATLRARKRSEEP
jgi:hypothetical protein